MAEAEPATFESLGLRPEIIDTLTKLGYEAPTPIQQRTIPLLLAQRDVIGQAQTGTGKTAAFALPVLQHIDVRSRATQALVMTPTRELAMQVAEAIHTYGRGIGNITVQPIYGGAPIALQLRHLQRGVQVVVGTPGRLIDHLDRGSLDLGSVRMLVLDEADEMLRMGFIDDVERILASAPAERQTALFSATMPPEVVRIAKTHLRDPERVEIEHRAMTAPAIEQRFLNISQNQKLAALTHILELEQSEAVLIFVRTKLGAAELAERLEGRGFAAVALHGDMTQAMREAVVRRLRSGQVEIVVATDVAARGLDVEQIAHVVNYDIPYDVEGYVHRIGRTGRAGRTGIATLFVTPRERRMLREIERYTGATIAPMKMPTHADLAARRVSVLKENIRAEIAQGDLDLYLNLVEQLVEEGPHDAAEIAAAAARLASAARSLAPPVQAAAAAAREREPREWKPREGGASGERERPVRRPAAERAEEEPKVQLMMGIGREEGIRPADVVGSIANEAGIPGRDIGPIDIRDDFTLVTVPARYAEKVVGSLRHAKFKGKPFEIRTAAAGEAPPRPKAPLRAGEREGRATPRSGAARKTGAAERGARTRTAGSPTPRSGRSEEKRTPFYERAPRKGAGGSKRPAGGKGGAGGRKGKR